MMMVLDWASNLTLLFWCMMSSVTMRLVWLLLCEWQQANRRKLHLFYSVAAKNNKKLTAARTWHLEAAHPTSVNLESKLYPPCFLSLYQSPLPLDLQPNPLLNPLCQRESHTQRESQHRRGTRQGLCSRQEWDLQLFGPRGDVLHICLSPWPNHLIHLSLFIYLCSESLTGFIFHHFSNSFLFSQSC